MKPKATLFQKTWIFIPRRLHVCKKRFDEWSARNVGNNANVGTGEGRYAVPLGDEIVDARTVTEQDVRTLLENVQNGNYAAKTYIPLRANTPSFLIDVVFEHSKGEYLVDNIPMAGEVQHLNQIMEEEEEGLSYGEHRPHGLDIDDLINILKGMGDPSYIVLQRNGRYAEVVSFYNKRNKHIVVSVDFADSVGNVKKNYKHEHYMNGYNAGYYNIIVTQFEPDSLPHYLSKNEIVYEKKR